MVRGLVRKERGENGERLVRKERRENGERLVRKERRENGERWRGENQISHNLVSRLSTLHKIIEWPSE